MLPTGAVVGLSVSELIAHVTALTVPEKAEIGVGDGVIIGVAVGAIVGTGVGVVPVIP